ncbi:calmodulin-binding protein 60 A-like isoform X2 [Iris pallida]|uniref:Calmodulin-binding protein 60 A-like isoform X2 n=1 Tax=Iris pallida TaxID=29817 RepID=A0AAX6GJZ2_IRIPA|nr:calmodulin-binding protein 60 A-like isoform X2 [Iris pallida]
MSSQKRHPEVDDGDGGSSDEKKRQKVPALREVIKEALKMDRVQKLFSALEPLVRRVVKEEVELALSRHLANMTRQCGKQIYPSTSRSLELQFMNKLSLPIFTGSRVEGEESSGINVALVDSSTGQVVMTGAESSVKIEVVVLEGDFEGDEDGNWTSEEFRNNIVREREGKRPILTGDVFLELNEGVGIVGELSFTDNSSWTRSRKFRLGARVSDGYVNGERVQEAKTEPFMVKDHRGELYRKHHPPLLWDEVWRLEKIGKDGAFHKRLASENINSVKDFLTMLTTDAPRLRNILGSGMSAKMWEAAVEHARTCMIPKQMYVYFANAGNQRNTGVGVVFNIVGEVLGVLSQGQFVSINDISSESEKANAHIMVKIALDQWDDVVAYDNMVSSSSHTHAQPASFSVSSIAATADNIYNSTSIYSLINEAAGLPSDTTSFGQLPETYISCTRGASSSGDAYALQASLEGIGSRHATQEATTSLFSDPLMLDECGGSDTLFLNGEGSLQRYLDADFSSLSQSLNVADSPADLGTAVTGFLAMSARSAARTKKANTVWGTLLSVWRWKISIKKIVAMKRIHQEERFC